MSERLLVFLSIGYVLSFLLGITSAFAGDSVTVRLQEVELREHSVLPLVSSTPRQEIRTDALKLMNANQLSDAVKHFSGIAVKDYGGVGGLKTVSIRSLGAFHTAVAYDGVAVNDAQTGQIDIGRFSLNNVDMLSLSIGQSAGLLQPARLYASAGILNIFTREPFFAQNRQINLSAGIKAGSWGFYMPSFRLEQKISQDMAVSFLAEGQKTDGDYPYSIRNGAYREEGRRKYSDVEQLNGEVNLYYSLPTQGKLKLKGYSYYSDRGLPGSVILYTDNKKQTLEDKNSFLQANYLQPLGNFTLLVNGKFNYSYNHYHIEDPAYPNGEEDNRYTQREYYVSVAAENKLTDDWSISLATDYIYNYLYSNYMLSGYPGRHTSLSNAAFQYDKDWITINGNLLFTYVDEVLDSGVKGGKDFTRLSPSLSVSVCPGWEPMRIRALYKEIFRAPTFNDLYYESSGNRELDPENTRQFNLGIVMSDRISKTIPFLYISADAYINRIDDKIVTMPRGSMFNWSVLNYGKVEIYGVDVNVKTEVSLLPKHQINLNAGYTYQKAIDITDRNSKTWKHQLPYTPKHSVNGHVSYLSPWFILSYNVLASGERHSERQNKASSRMPGYYDHSVCLAKDFSLFKGMLRLQAECLNVFDKNYEIVRYFPMPGRSCRFAMVFNY